MTLKITLVNDEVHIVRGVYDWSIADNIINIYSHTITRDKDNIVSDRKHNYKIYKNDVKEIRRTEGEDIDVL